MSLLKVPPEVVSESLLPSLSLSDIFSLGATCQSLYCIIADNHFWYRKTKADFNPDGLDASKIKSWMRIYKNLSSSSLYIWRVGAQWGAGSQFPAQVGIPGTRIVNLVSARWSFHALDARGSIYVLGALSDIDVPAAFRNHHNRFSNPGAVAAQPMRLDVPATFRSIACGTRFVVALDSISMVWTFTTWTQPFKLKSRLVDNSSPIASPVQVTCGENYVAILTQSSDILVYSPFGPEVSKQLRARGEEPQNRDASTTTQVEDSEQTIYCHHWYLDGVDPSKLPRFPAHSLPDDLSNEDEIKIIKIAGIKHHLFALTNKGHILKYGRLVNGAYSRGEWQYLPHFSELSRLRKNPSWPKHVHQSPFPHGTRIVNISASDATLVAHTTGSPSIVLARSFDDFPQDLHFHYAPPNADAILHISDVKPTTIHLLQDHSVVSVMQGDTYIGALTSSGILLTWTQSEHIPVTGSQSEPVEVTFGQSNTRQYVLSCTAAGRHVGALVANLEGD